MQRFGNNCQEIAIILSYSDHLLIINVKTSFAATATIQLMIMKITRKHSEKFEHQPRIFVFYFWLSVGIVIVNKKESFKIPGSADRDPDRQ